MPGKVKLTRVRPRTVEHEPGCGWIARCPATGRELGGVGFRWRTRSVARTVVDEERLLPEYLNAGRAHLSSGRTEE